MEKKKKVAKNKKKTSEEAINKRRSIPNKTKSNYDSLKKKKQLANKKKIKKKLSEAKKSHTTKNKKKALESIDEKSVNNKAKVKRVSKKKVKKIKKTGFFKNPKYRKIRAVLFYMLMIFLVVSVAVILSTTVLFRISEVVVLGDSDYSSDDIIECSGIIKGEGLMFCNENSIRKNIESKLPYISEAQVNKILPNKIEIVVKKALPEAMFEADKKFIIIDRNSKVLEISNERNESAAILLGAKPLIYELSDIVSYEDENTKQIINEIITDFNDSGIGKLTKIDLEDQFNINVTYDDRIIIKIGKPIDIKYKAEIAATVINRQSVVSANEGTLDVSLSLEGNKTYFKPKYD